ncbi:MAG: hypothetical protein RIQ89_623 [Bacteroidota bacterium]|jgi:uncharacterized protein (TIGR02453 family)
MIAASTLDFLKQLKKHNNRDWFEKHRQRYLDAKENHESFIENLLPKLVKVQPDYHSLGIKDVTFRIYRDVRFSKNKDPYKTNFGAGFNKGGKKMIQAGYYLHLEPGASFVASGIWMPPAEELRKIRQEIAFNSKEFEKILLQKDFKKWYGQLDQSFSLKSAPRGYEKDHPYIHFIKMNSYIVSHSFSDQVVLKPSFEKEVLDAVKIGKAFVGFINRSFD